LRSTRDYHSRIADGDGYEAAHFGFRNTDIFAQMKADRLPVLARDVVELERMVAALIETSIEMSPRINAELPKLRGMAAEIIEMIETEYGDS
jgi:hypothetical protein